MNPWAKCDGNCSRLLDSDAYLPMCLLVSFWFSPRFDAAPVQVLKKEKKPLTAKQKLLAKMRR